MLVLLLLGSRTASADLMAISDVLITKPGPGSVCEALRVENVPMILDQTGSTMMGEKRNCYLHGRSWFC